MIIYVQIHENKITPEILREKIKEIFADACKIEPKILIKLTNYTDDGYQQIDYYAEVEIDPNCPAQVSYISHNDFQNIAINSVNIERIQLTEPGLWNFYNLL